MPSLASYIVLTLLSSLAARPLELALTLNLILKISYVIVRPCPLSHPRLIIWTSHHFPWLTIPCLMVLILAAHSSSACIYAAGIFPLIIVPQHLFIVSDPILCWSSLRTSSFYLALSPCQFTFSGHPLNFSSITLILAHAMIHCPKAITSLSLLFTSSHHFQKFSLTLPNTLHFCWPCLDPTTL